MRKWALTSIFILALAGAAFISYDLRRPYRGYAGNVVLAIGPGMRSPEVTDVLVGRGVLHHHLPFFLLNALGRPRHRFIKAGEYLFDRPLTPLQVYHKLVQGEVYVRTVLIPEGTDRFEMARIFQDQLGISPVEFLRVTQVTAPVHDLDPQAASLEGFLFPDTYRFPYGANAGVVVTTMLGRFRHVLDARFPEVRQPPDRVHDLVTLASLVEKETPISAERPRVAGVFRRRLEKGMMLQCDPSVVYAERLDRLVTQSIGGMMNLNVIAPVSDPITEQELQIDSPYNTYTHAGLPRGPICSPGEASIQAALNPAPGNSLYFVSNNQGGHLFASTLAEHNRNVVRYHREMQAAERTRPDDLGSGALRPNDAEAGQRATRRFPAPSSGQGASIPPNAPARQDTPAVENAPTQAGAQETLRGASNAAGKGSRRQSGRHRVKHKRQTRPKQEGAHS
jgi:UPF0755 protein